MCRYCEELEADKARLEAEVVRLVGKCRRLEDAERRTASKRGGRKSWTTNPKAKGAKE